MFDKPRHFADTLWRLAREKLPWTSRGRRLPNRQPSYVLSPLAQKVKPFLNFRNGFYVEAGANDGLNQSNTVFLENELGWTGLLVEPIPEKAERCRLNRRGSIVENCALVASGYPDRSVQIYSCDLMSTTAGAMSEEDMREHLARGLQAQNLASARKLTVPAFTLESLLRKHAIEHIDFLSLDVEGYELEVLKGLNLQCVRPTWLLVEARDKNVVNTFLAPWYVLTTELHQALDTQTLKTYSDLLFHVR